MSLTINHTFDGLNTDKDSFAIVLGEEDTRNGVYFMFRQKILNNEMAPEDYLEH